MLQHSNQLSKTVSLITDVSVAAAKLNISVNREGSVMMGQAQ